MAFATADGITIDEHFGRAGMFKVYEITQDGYGLIETRKFAEGRDSAIEGTRDMGLMHEEAVQAKVNRLSDCKIIFIAEIGGPSAARLIRKGIMPVKIKAPSPIEEEAQRLYESLKTSPPPWLRKSMEEE